MSYVRVVLVLAFIKQEWETLLAPRGHRKLANMMLGFSEKCPQTKVRVGGCKAAASWGREDDLQGFGLRPTHREGAGPSLLPLSPGELPHGASSLCAWGPQARVWNKRSQRGVTFESAELTAHAMTEKSHLGVERKTPGDV